MAKMDPFTLLIIVIALFAVLAALGLMACETNRKDTELFNISEAETESGKNVPVGFVIRAPKNDRIKTIIVADESHEIFYYDLRK